MSNDITVILNGYKRPQRLREQLDALSKQSIQPSNVFYWQNSMPGIQYDSESANKCVSTLCNTNFGVWSRFYHAMNARTNWVCIFDDDTIPGPLWLENCLNTFGKTPGLLGTIGVIFPENAIYHNIHRIGWDNPNEETREVDIVGHSWFFHRDMLSIFSRELPPIDQVPFVGEDIHFSHMLQKYSNYKTFVPPHPKDNKELWGSLRGWEYGDDGLATASTCIEYIRNDLTRAVNSGFKLINHA